MAALGLRYAAIVAADREVLFDDLADAARTRSPELPALIARFLAQGDPPDGVPEEADPDAVEVAPGAAGLQSIAAATSVYALRGKTATERKNARREAWEAALTAAHPTPRLRVSQLLIELYEAPDAPAHALVLEVMASIPLMYGPWQAIKAIYKRAEARHDALMFGVLATRFDPRPPAHGEVGIGTLVYLGRRAWRYLRMLGRAVPELYVPFAVEVLRRYPADADLGRAWIANHIWGHRALIGNGRGRRVDWRKKLTDRYLDAAWKTSAAPLLGLLETCLNDEVAALALAYLEKDFPDTLRAPGVPWLVRLIERRLPAIEAFVVKVLRETPELHVSRFRELGLHEPVLGMMTSRSAEARAFALAYARAHAGDVGVETLVSWMRVNDREVRTFALARLGALDARAIGALALAHLASASEALEIAKKKLAELPLDAVDLEVFVTLATGTHQQRRLLDELFAKTRPAVALLLGLLDDQRCDHGARNYALRQLAQVPGEAIDFGWVRTALLSDRLGAAVADWLRAGKFKHPTLDVAWVKSLVARPKLRPLAIEVLAHADWVPPAALGVSWLVGLLDHADPALSAFAEERLIASFAPADLGGIDGVIALLAKPSEGAVRLGARYLAAHHPELAGEAARGIAAALPRGDFTLARLRPLFFHASEAVRALAARIGAHEIVGWGDARLPYVLAESPFREARQLARDVLTNAGESGAAPASWLDRDAVFALAESRHKATRELGVALVRRHYEALGARDRLSWLMESPDREVRLFAVRLLWERHRPHALPAGFRPKVAPGVAAPVAHGGAVRRDDDLVAFLRTSMFGLPPGRMERRDAAAPKPIPASVAKQRLVEVVRDMAIEDRAFAELVAPILRDFARSSAKGEWQACVAALARIGAAHAGLGLDSRPPREARS